LGPADKLQCIVVFKCVHWPVYEEQTRMNESGFPLWSSTANRKCDSMVLVEAIQAGFRYPALANLVE